MAGTKGDRYDVFIVHSTDDADKAMIIDKALQKRGYHTCAHYRERNFDLGKPVFDNIIACVERSAIILILLTANAIGSQWVTFEILMSLEKAHREKEMGLRLVMEGVTKEQREKFKTGELEFLPEILLDFSMDGWEDELVNGLKEKVSMTDILPTGNVSHGLVFNYFTGYLRHILPGFRAALMASEVYRLHPGTTYSRFIMLLPNSCAVPKIESHGTLHVQKEGFLSIEIISGDKPRVFKLPIYSIAQNGEEYHFLGECPNILSTIAKLAGLGIPEARVDLRMQAEKFRILLDELVNHRENNLCNDSVTLISYNDTDGNISAAGVIWEELQKKIPFIPQSLDQIDEESPKIIRHVGTTDKSSSYLTITNCDLPKDTAVAEQIMTFLKFKNINFTNGDGQMELSVLQNARWNIFVLSRDSIPDPRMARQYDSAIAECLNNNRVQVIPILVEGSDVADLPSRIKWTTVLQQSSSDYLEKLWTTIQGGDVKMQERIQAGDVATGLAWTYLLNYLPVAILGKTKSGRGLRERFEDAISKYNPGCPCVPRLFIIIPTSCAFPAPGHEIQGEEYLGPVEEYLGQLEPIMEGFRPYVMHFYRLKLQNGDQYCYAREYATPTEALYQMCHNYPFAGIHTEELHAQSAQFAGHLRDIVGNQDFMVKVGDLRDGLCLVPFDDSQVMMPDALGRELVRYAKEGDLIK